LFTGLIQDIGEVIDNIGTRDVILIIRSKKLKNKIQSGGSIAINGACQTITEISDELFKVFTTRETLSITNLSKLKKGDRVNLELPCTPNTFLDGHIVQGHIDDIAKIHSIENRSGSCLLEIMINDALADFIVEKGSIAIDGISLTINKIIDNNIVRISIIPTTFKETTLSLKKVGDIVNIETDILGKYILKRISSGIITKNGIIQEKLKLTKEYLIDNGY